MNLNIPSDVSDAVNILESWEQSINHYERTRDFEDAIDILNEYMQDDEYLSLRTYIRNMKKTYTRKLLEKLPSFPPLQIDEWFNYSKILLLLAAEVDEITKDNPSLKENERNFLNICISILSERVKKTNQK